MGFKDKSTGVGSRALIEKSFEVLVLMRDILASIFSDICSVCPKFFPLKHNFDLDFHPSTFIWQKWLIEKKLATKNKSKTEKASAESFDFCREDWPGLSHKWQLHYVNAVISESMRKSSVVPSGVPHYVEEDTWIDNYFFPKV